MRALASVGALLLAGCSELASVLPSEVPAGIGVCVVLDTVQICASTRGDLDLAVGSAVPAADLGRGNSDDLTICYWASPGSDGMVLTQEDC